MQPQEGDILHDLAPEEHTHTEKLPQRAGTEEFLQESTLLQLSLRPVDCSQGC